MQPIDPCTLTSRLPALLDIHHVNSSNIYRDQTIAASHAVLTTVMLHLMCARASQQSFPRENMHVVCLQDGWQQKRSGRPLPHEPQQTTPTVSASSYNAAEWRSNAGSVLVLAAVLQVPAQPTVATVAPQHLGRSHKAVTARRMCVTVVAAACSFRITLSSSLGIEHLQAVALFRLRSSARPSSI